MADISVFLFLVSLLCLIVVLVRPEVFTRFLKSSSNRQTIAIIVGSATLVLFLLTVAFAESPEPPKEPGHEPVSAKKAIETVEETKTISYQTKKEEDLNLLTIF